jgi:sugar phosphate isomerase/epimerase
MQLGSALYTYLWECSLDQAIERCARAGFRTRELTTSPPHLWPSHVGPFERRRLRRRLSDAGISVCSLNPTFLDHNIISLNPAIRAASMAEIEDNIRLAADLEAGLVVVATGRRHPLIPSPRVDAEALAVETIAGFVCLGQSLGVTIGIENIPTALASTGEEIRRLVERVGDDRCRVVFDVANAHMVEEPAAGLRAVGSLAALVHVSDTRRGAWGHLPVGMGEVDLAAALAAVREIGYPGPIILETTYPDDPDGGISRSIAALARFGIAP